MFLKQKADRTMVFPPPADNSPGSSGHYLEGAQAARLLKVLDRARYGTLSATWRDELLPANDTDPERLLIEEFRLNPYAPWEPGHAQHWREALDSWYVASRTALTAKFVWTSRTITATTGSPNGLLRSALLTNSLPGMRVDLAEQLITKVAPLDQQNDKSRMIHEEAFIQERDRLTVAYLAPLASRGEIEMDWLDWYRQRIEAWPRIHINGRRPDIELNDSSFRTVMERLPSYWQ